MKRMILSACAGLIGAVLASPSPAADLPRKAPLYTSPEPVYTWTGLYLGVNGGYAWGNAKFSNALGDFDANNQTGWLAGGTIGYNFQTGTWVFGLEGDVDFAWLKGNAVNTFGAGCAGGGGCDVKNTFFATARGRVGYAWDRFMPYITGGAAFANAKISAPAGTSTTTTNYGWTIGGGLEFAFSGPWSAKVEYLYADLGKATCGASVCGLDTDFKFKANIVRAGINYRF